MLKNLLRTTSSSTRRILSTNTIKISSNKFSTVNFYFYEELSKQKIKVEGREGESVLDVALRHDIDIEGACGGELACSTCHVIVEPELYKTLPKKSEEEEDMLDLAWGLTDYSRLCCQLKVNKSLEGTTFKVPSESNNNL